MKDFLSRRVLQPLRLLLVQGMSPRLLALSIATGAIVGIFPVLGTTTVLCTIAAAALRLNLVAVQTVHFVLTPVQVGLIIPFVRVGETVLGRPPQPLSIDAGLAIISQGAVHAVTVLWDAILHAILGWILIGPALLLILFLILARVLAAKQLELKHDEAHS